MRASTGYAGAPAAAGFDVSADASRRARLALGSPPAPSASSGAAAPLRPAAGSAAAPALLGRYKRLCLLQLSGKHADRMSLATNADQHV